MAGFDLTKLINWTSGLIPSATDLNDGLTSLIRASGGPRTTSVPGSPTDEDVLVYPADTTNGVMWGLKYRSASGSAYKWENKNGVMYAAVATDETTASTTYVDIATVGPSVTVPRAGDYEVEVGATMWDVTGGTACYAAVKRGAAATADADAATAMGTTATPGTSVSRKIIMTGLAASDVLKVQYKVNGGTGHFIFRWIAVRPLRIS